MSIVSVSLALLFLIELRCGASVNTINYIYFYFEISFYIFLNSGNSHLTPKYWISFRSSLLQVTRWNAYYAQGDGPGAVYEAFGPSPRPLTRADL